MKNTGSTPGSEYDAWYRTPRGAWIGEAEFRLLVAMLRPRAGETLLDVGCGTGYFTRRFAAETGVAPTGLDPNEDWLAYARAHAAAGETYLKGHAEALPFPERSFDLAVSVTALCFVADQRAAVREMLRAARTRIALGLLNRRSLLYLEKGRRGGTGAYRGAHWHTHGEIRELFAGLPVGGLGVRSAIFLPYAPGRGVEALIPNRCPLGAFLVAAAEVAPR